MRLISPALKEAIEGRLKDLKVESDDIEQEFLALAGKLRLLQDSLRGLHGETSALIAYLESVDAAPQAL